MINKEDDNSYSKEKLSKVLKTKFPSLLTSFSGKEINYIAQSHIKDIEKSNSDLNTMSSFYLPREKNRKVAISLKKALHNKQINFSRLSYRNPEKKAQITIQKKNFSQERLKTLKVPSIRKKMLLTEKKEQKKKKIFFPLKQQNNETNYSTRSIFPNKNNRGNNEPFVSRMKMISSFEEISKTKYNIFKLELSKKSKSKSLKKFKKKLKIKTEKLELGSIKDILEKQYKAERHYIYNTRSFITENLKSKDILYQYDQISKISSHEMYKLRKELCFQMGLSVVESNNEMGFERLVPKYWKFSTPRWVLEAKQKQKEEIMKVLKLRDKSQTAIKNIFNM